MGLLPLFNSCLSHSLCSGIKVAVSRDKYNILLLNLSNSTPASVPKYIIPCYTHSILPINYIFSTIFAPIFAPIFYTFCVPPCNPAPSSTAIAASLPTLE